MLVLSPMESNNKKFKLTLYTPWWHKGEKRGTAPFILNLGVRQEWWLSHCSHLTHEERATGTH